MATKKLLRDLVLSKNPVYRQFLASQKVLVATPRLRFIAAANGGSSCREFGVFNKFSKQVKGEVNRNQEFQQSVKEFKEKAEELKGVKEDLKVRTKQTTEQLYKHVDGAWTEAEATAKKVSANLKDTVSAATEEVKETLGIGKQESSESSSSSVNNGSEVKDDSKSESGGDKQQQSAQSDTAQTIFGKVRSGVSSIFPQVSSSFQKLKDIKIIDLAKKSFDVVKDELSGGPRKRKHIEYAASSAGSGQKVERSTRTDVTVIASKQPRWSKKWEEFKEKMQGHPVFKRVSGLSEPVVAKSQEIAEDMRERWETSDHPVVHKIQDINESVFGETGAAITRKEMLRRDPHFSLPEFVSEVQEVVKPVLNAYIKGDVEVLKKYCSPEIIERCQAEHKAYESQGIFFDYKILHISDVDVRETKMMGNSPLIILGFQTQQVYCVRDRTGKITDGGKDTIHTVHYLWAMQQVDVEELGEDALFPIWRLRDMQQLGIQALI